MFGSDGTFALGHRVNMSRLLLLGVSDALFNYLLAVRIKGCSCHFYRYDQGGTSSSSNNEVNDFRYLMRILASQ